MYIFTKVTNTIDNYISNIDNFRFKKKCWFTEVSVIGLTPPPSSYRKCVVENYMVKKVPVDYKFAKRREPNLSKYPTYDQILKLLT